MFLGEYKRIQQPQIFLGCDYDYNIIKIYFLIIHNVSIFLLILKFQKSRALVFVLY